MFEEIAAMRTGVGLHIMCEWQYFNVHAVSVTAANSLPRTLNHSMPWEGYNNLTQLFFLVSFLSIQLKVYTVNLVFGPLLKLPLLRFMTILLRRS